MWLQSTLTYWKHYLTIPYHYELWRVKSLQCFKLKGPFPTFKDTFSSWFSWPRTLHKYHQSLKHKHKPTTRQKSPSSTSCNYSTLKWRMHCCTPGLKCLYNKLSSRANSRTMSHISARRALQKREQKRGRGDTSKQFNLVLLKLVKKKTQKKYKIKLICQQTSNKNTRSATAMMLYETKLGLKIRNNYIRHPRWICVKI